MIPVSGLAKLSKKVFDITGPDAAKFLNGLVTTRFLPNIIKKNQYTISDVESRHLNLSKIINVNENWGIMHEDIYDPENDILIRRDGLYSMFLNSKGRVLTDAFLYPNPFIGAATEASYLTEIDSAIGKKLEMVIKMHKLTSKINLTSPQFHSYYYYNDSVEFDEFLDFLQSKYFNTFTPRDASVNAAKFLKEELVINQLQSDNVVGFAIDNRIPNFGLKVLTKEPIDSSFFSEQFQEKFGVVKPIDESFIKKRRFLNGLFESIDAPANFSLLPFDMNLDYINGLSLDKGCYVGQELTIRTFNSGVIRKRIVAVQFFEINESNFERCDTDELELIEDDEVIQQLGKINQSSIDKLEITTLYDQPEPESEMSSSPFGKSVKPRRQKVGKLLATDSNLGFMLINLKDMHHKYFKVEVPDLQQSKFIGIKVIKPDWWPEE